MIGRVMPSRGPTCSRHEFRPAWSAPCWSDAQTLASGAHDLRHGWLAQRADPGGEFRRSAHPRLGVAGADLGFAKGLPIRLLLTAGQAHDSTVAGELLEGLGKGAMLLADKAYDTDAIRVRQVETGGWGRTSRPSPTARTTSSSARTFTELATVSNASSTTSNTSAASPPVTIQHDLPQLDAALENVAAPVAEP